MSRLSIVCGLLLGLLSPSEANPEESVLTLAGHFTVTPGGKWLEPEGEKGRLGPIHLNVQGYIPDGGTEEQLFLMALRVLEPETVSGSALDELDAKKMIEVMLFSFRSDDWDKKLRRTEPVIRPLKGWAPAKFFYKQTIGSGENALFVSGVTMEAEGGATAIQVVWTGAEDKNPYDSPFWKKLIKTITPVKDAEKQ